MIPAVLLSFLTALAITAVWGGIGIIINSYLKTLLLQLDSSKCKGGRNFRDLINENGCLNYFPNQKIKEFLPSYVDIGYKGIKMSLRFADKIKLENDCVTIPLDGTFFAKNQREIRKYHSDIKCFESQSKGIMKSSSPNTL